MPKLYFASPRDLPQKDPAPGMTQRIIRAEAATIAITDLAPKTVVESHKHPMEQTGVVTKGSLVTVLALAILFGTIVYSWTAQATRGRTFGLTTTPIALVLTDLFVATLWMVATAPDVRSVAFALVLIASVLVQFRLGRVGILIAAVAFVLALVGQPRVPVAPG